MGVGEVTISEHITSYLSKLGEKAQYYEEDDLDHPADYPFHAYMRDEQIKELEREAQKQLYAEGIKTVDGRVIPLTKISVNLFGKVLPYKIYGRLDWESEKKVLLEKWRKFAEKTRIRRRVYIFNGCFLHNPVREMMMRFDLDASEIKDYVASVLKCIAPLAPVVIYARSTNIKARVEELARQYKPNWLRDMIESYTATGFGKRCGLKGYDGYLACLNARQELELEVLAGLPIDNMILKDPFNDLNDTEKTLNAFVDRLYK